MSADDLEADVRLLRKLRQMAKAGVPEFTNKIGRVVDHPNVAKGLSRLIMLGFIANHYGEITVHRAGRIRYASWSTGSVYFKRSPIPVIHKQGKDSRGNALDTRV